MKIHFFKFIFLFLMLVTIVALVGGYFNLIPKAATFMGTNRSKDLGITYNEGDVKKLSEKSGITSTTLLPTSEIPTYSGSKELEISLNSKDLTAWARDKGWKNYPVKNAQIKINNNGSVEASAIIVTDKLAKWISSTGGNAKIVETIKSKLPVKLSELPVYAKGTAQVTNNEVTINFDKVSVANIPVPGNLLSDNKDYIESFIEERMKYVSGLYVESLKFESGEMQFKGTVPKIEKFE